MQNNLSQLLQAAKQSLQSQKTLKRQFKEVGNIEPTGNHVEIRFLSIVSIREILPYFNGSPLDIEKVKNSPAFSFIGVNLCFLNKVELYKYNDTQKAFIIAHEVAHLENHQLNDFHDPQIDGMAYSKLNELGYDLRLIKIEEIILSNDRNYENRLKMYQMALITFHQPINK